MRPITLLFCLWSFVATAQSDIILGDSMGLRAVVRVAQGGRLASLQLRGHEVLTTPDSKAGQFVWGNSCWTMPQSVWNWPPRPAHDDSTYRITKQTPTSLELVGPPDDKTGFRLTKTYTLNRPDSSLTVGCTYTNTSQKAQWLAPWEISRSPRGGVVLVRVESVRQNNKFSYPTQVRRDSVTAFTIPPLLAPRDAGAKINIDARAKVDNPGVLAYAHNGYLFVKTFANVPAAQLAPNEGDAEIYVSEAYDYLELEETGPYQLVQPGQSVPFETRWTVRKLPNQWRINDPLPMW